MIIRANETVDSTIDFAKKFLDVPYIWGGNCSFCQSGMDCSGYAQKILWYCGLDQKGDQTAQGIYNFMEQQSWRSQLGKGAWIFYGKSRFEISHIAFQISDDEIIEAGGGGRNTIKPTPNAKIRIKSIEHRKDIVAVIMPKYRED